MFNKILFVCVGNICRSPMAEALLKARAWKAHRAITVQSAGIAAMVGHEAHPIVKEILSREDIDCASHRARQLTTAMILSHDLVLVMEKQHYNEIIYTFPSACGKVHLLGKWGNFEVPDPYRKASAAFDETYSLIQAGLDEWQMKLWK